MNPELLIFSFLCSGFSGAVQQGPEGRYGSVPVTLPVLAGGRKCLNLGQSLTGAPWGGSGFLFVGEWDHPVVFRKACETCGSSCYLLQTWKINSAHAVCSGELRSLLLLIHGIFSSFSL